MSEPTVTQTEQVYAYFAIRSCNCMIAAIIDDPTWNSEKGLALSQWANLGLRIERGPIALVAAMQPCPHNRPERYSVGPKSKNKKRFYKGESS